MIEFIACSPGFSQLAEQANQRNAGVGTFIGGFYFSGRLLNTLIKVGAAQQPLR